jgi:hypothetical protein
MLPLCIGKEVKSTSILVSSWIVLQKISDDEDAKLTQGGKLRTPDPP